ncbi:MAG: pyruvate kinase [Clostridiales bacterium]|nr:pyruvate kinase [Clostridiales bacterium]
MRKTKIICTIGPASSDEKTLEDLMLKGMNVARLNFSHGTYENFKMMIDSIKKAREKLQKPVAIMLDTKGPEYRIGLFEGGSAELSEGSEFSFTHDDAKGNSSHVSVSYKDLAKELDVGDRILVNNGLLIFEVTSIKNKDVVCKVVSGGIISDRKSMSFPGKVLKQKFLSEKDKEDILFGIKEDVDYIACSFVSQRQDLIDVKKFLKENGSDIPLIAKIENQSGIDNIEDICKECEGIMIGRGDMGVEIPFERLPVVQKQLITKCRMLGKRVITATEMLESMINNPRPTRAEISDVANAVYDGTSVVMLSGETAVGKHPALTVETMAKILSNTEEHINYKKRFYDDDFTIKNTMDAISHSACTLSMDIDAKAIAVCSLSGMTARMVSRFRPPIDIIGVCTNEKTYRKLALSWGVTPVMTDNFTSAEVLFYTVKNLVKNELGLEKGDNIVITGGTMTGKSGGTNTLRVETIE